MRVRCYLRGFRGRRSLRQVAGNARETGLNAAELSRIEQGRMVPKDSQLAAIEQAYGQPPERWWPPEVLRVLDLDDEETRIRDEPA